MNNNNNDNNTTTTMIAREKTWYLKESIKQVFVGNKNVIIII